MINNEAQLHPNSLVEDGASVGKGSRIWAFTHILPGAVIGADCNICDQVFIENDVRVGDRVTIKSGVQLWDGLCIEDDVFIGPNVTFTNDKFPRSKCYPEAYLKTVVKHGASIGANASILPGLIIGAEAMIGAGAVVTGNVPPKAIVVGNPARITGYVGVEEAKPVPSGVGEFHVESSVAKVKIIELDNVDDLRGDLTAFEWEGFLPFSPKRMFFVYNVPGLKVRGEHAHKECHQFLLCVKGSLSVIVDDGEHREEHRFDSLSRGIYIPPGVWGIQYKYSKDAVLCVIASHKYDSDDYIRDYDEFLASIA